jgi:type I restriction enzyme S subunit
MDLIKLLPSTTKPLWLYSSLRYSGISYLIAQHANGTNVLHLRPETFSGIYFVVPPLSLQEAYQDFVAPIFAKTQLLDAQIIKLAEARDRLLPKLMTSEIEV